MDGVNNPDALDHYFAVNRANWDERTSIHLRDNTGIYDRGAVVAGADALGPIEAAELGNVAGKRVLHLQCHFGMDTVSLARRGADATGLDFSPVAVAAARELAADCKLDVRFVEGNVYDAPAVAGRDFDMVFTGWGAIGWLPDIRRWARAVSDCLRPGGSLYLIEGHPTLFLFEEVDGRIELTYDWKTPADAPIKEVDGTSYAGDGSEVRNSTTYGWNHPLSAIFKGLADAGLQLVFFHEHEAIPWRAFASMQRRPDRMYVQRDGQLKIPLSFSLGAVKTA